MRFPQDGKIRSVSHHDDMESRIYVLNHLDEIVDVQGSWNCDTSKFKKQKLWQFFSSPQLSNLLAALFDKSRVQRVSKSLQFRCDSSTARQVMQLVIEPLEANQLKCTVQTVKSTPRQVPVSLTTRRVDDEVFLVMCSWCSKLKSPQGWLEVEEVYESLPLEQNQELPPITHTMCEQCSEEIMAEIE